MFVLCVRSHNKYASKTNDDDNNELHNIYKANSRGPKTTGGGDGNLKERYGEFHVTVSSQIKKSICLCESN